MHERLDNQMRYRVSFALNALLEGVCVAVLALGISACSPTEPPPEIEDTSAAVGDSANPPEGALDTEESEEERGYERPTGPSNTPGVSLRRLDRLAYNNSVRDLFGLTTKPAERFPADPPSLGFDNLSDHLSISPLWMEYFAQAASQIAATVMAPESSTPFEVVVEAETLDAPDESFPYAGVGVGLYSLYPLSAALSVPEAGSYTLEVLAWREKVYWTGNIAPSVALIVDGEQVAELSVIADSEQPQLLSAEVSLEAGEHSVAVRVMNPQASIDEEVGFMGVVVAVDWIKLSSSDVLVVTPSLRSSVLSCAPEEGAFDPCGREILADLTRRAWRRPPADDEVTTLMGFIEDAVAGGEGFEAGVQTALEAVLLSPHFLFLVEMPPLDEPESTQLDSYQVAARLAHFLWSSVPDEALNEAAASGALLSADEIAAQTERMLDDPKAQALFDNLADQWLLARKVETIQPNLVVFDDFDDALRQAMAEEVRHFLRSFVSGERTLFDLVASSDVFINDVLAKHYDMAPVGPEFVRVESHGAPRGGVLRQAGVLSANSHPYRTSPTRRGQWILEKLLCTDIGAPPPGQALFFDPTRLDEAFTETPQLLLHFTDPTCAGCHVMMDPLGLAMESYDAIGRHRSVDQALYDDLEAVFDASVILRSTEQVIDKVVEDPDFLRCVVQQVYTYALGRGPLADDDVAIDLIVEQLPEFDYSFRGLLVAITASEPFRQRLVDLEARGDREVRP